MRRSGEVRFHRQRRQGFAAARAIWERPDRLHTRFREVRAHSGTVAIGCRNSYLSVPPSGSVLKSRGASDLARHPGDGSGLNDANLEIGRPAGLDTGSAPALQ
jgi:hypothetical protein